MRRGCAWIGLVAVLGAAAGARADTVVSLKDPPGDDNGPGSYAYPTDAVYTPGSFDLTAFEVDTQGDDIVFKVSVRGRIEDPWNSPSWQGNGFSLQFAQVYIDTDHKAGSGFVDGLPGTNIRVPQDSAWDRVVLISPQGRSRLDADIRTKARDMKNGIVVPRSVRVQGSTLEAVVPADALGARPAKGWGYLVVMLGNENFPAFTSLLTRAVNAEAGAHRFGGGSDEDCDPSVIDLIAAPGKGGADEAATQHDVLKFTCDPDHPEKNLKVVVPLVYP